LSGYFRGRKDNLILLGELATEIRVTYRTLLRMRDIIKRAAGKYRGHKSSAISPLHLAPQYFETGIFHRGYKSNLVE
jgi:hypothetical protein